MRNMSMTLYTPRIDQPCSNSRYPEAVLASTSLLHVHEPCSVLWIVSSGSMVMLSSLTRTRVLDTPRYRACVTPSVLHPKSFMKTCHEHHVYVLVHVIKCVNQFLVT